jgi:hypothetical protein
VGWATADHLRTELICDALANAVATRNPAPGVVFHSDRGCQGEFQWSSQHLSIEEVVRGVTTRVVGAGGGRAVGWWSPAVGGGSGVAASDAFARAAGAIPRGRARVLAVDR